jgi:hypothetical protein
MTGSITFKELRTRFEKEFEQEIKKGVCLWLIMPIAEGESGMRIIPKLEDDQEVNPKNHKILISQPFIYDARNSRKTFMGFQLEGIVLNHSLPDHFRLDEEGILSYKECWNPERILAYATENALDICEQLNDYTLTLSDICDIITNGDFERYKKKWELMEDEDEEEDNDDDEWMEEEE